MLCITLFIQGLFLQYLNKTVVTILYLHYLYKDISTDVHLLLSLQMSLQVSLHGDILRNLYGSISTIVHLLLSLFTSLICEVLRPSLRASLQSKFLPSSLLVSLRSGILQSSLLTSLLGFLWNIFLQFLYKDIPTVTHISLKHQMIVQGIHSKPEILLQHF